MKGLPLGPVPLSSAATASPFLDAVRTAIHHELPLRSDSPLAHAVPRV